MPRPVVKTCMFMDAASCSVPQMKSLAGVAAKIKPFCRDAFARDRMTPAIALVPAFAVEPSAFSTMLVKPPFLFPGVGLALRSTPPRSR